LGDQSVRLIISKPNVPICPFLKWFSGQPHYEFADKWFCRRFMSKWWIAFAPISASKLK